MKFIEMRMKKSGEKEHCRGKRALPGKEKILINTRIKADITRVKRKERMSNIVVKIQEVIKESHIFRAFELNIMKLTYI